MSIEENKSIVVRHIKEFVEHGKLDLTESYSTPDGTDPQMWNVAQWKDIAIWHYKHCPGFKINLQQLVAVGEWIMAWIQFDLTYSVEDPSRFNYPFGKPFSLYNANIHRVVNGKAVFERFYGNDMDKLMESGEIKLVKAT